MTEVKLRPDGKPEEQRIRDRLKPSSSPAAVSSQVQMGDGPTRVVHTTHHSGHQAVHSDHGSKSVLRQPMAGPPIMGRKE
jgi:hypothetical protein